MELIKAVEKLVGLKRDVKNMDEWLVELELRNSPVNGLNWRRLKKAIDQVIYDVQAEANELEIKIKDATEKININV